MIPLTIALTSAVLFLGLSIVIYGAGVLAESTWVAMVFWGLIGSGVAVYLVNLPTPRWLQDLGDRMTAMSRRDCAPCTH